MSRRAVGLVPYYRRRLRTGAVRVYLRDADRKTSLVLCMDATLAATIAAGVPYTVEMP